MILYSSPTSIFPPAFRLLSAQRFSIAPSLPQTRPLIVDHQCGPKLSLNHLVNRFRSSISPYLLCLAAIVGKRLRSPISAITAVPAKIFLHRLFLLVDTPPRRPESAHAIHFTIYPLVGSSSSETSFSA